MFLTRIPVGGFPYSADDWQWAGAHFPLVGGALGALMAGAYWSLLPAGSWPAAVGALALSLLLTGAFHEDGLADTADALGGGHDRERVLAILKDSRIGSFGASALVISLVGRAALLAEIEAMATAALVVSQVASRVTPIWLMVLLPYVTRQAARSREVTRARLPQALVATGWGVAIAGTVWWAWSLPPRWALYLVGTLALAAGLCGWRFQRRVGGITGDFLGATQQVGELVLLATWAWLAGRPWPG